MEKIRDATHKGTWYNSDPKALEIELSNYLKCANVVPKSKAKAILVPHAGYRYSGQTAAFGYKLIKPSEFDTIVLLGPSHKVWLDSCALSKCAQYATPFGNIDIDTVAVEKLYESKEFVYMDLNVDENEHSLEMHLPFIFHTMR
jgi:AmmeMemoRadiSam system protein B